MSVETYVGLIVEGLSRQGANKAVELRARQNGINYTRVNWNRPQNRPTFDVCALFIGQVYHTGGAQDPLGFPSLSEMPGGAYLPQHPRCRHWFTPWDPAVEGPGQVAKLKTLSDLIPRRFLGMPAPEATKEVRKLVSESDAPLFAIAPMAFGEGAESSHPALKGQAA